MELWQTLLVAGAVGTGLGVGLMVTVVTIRALRKFLREDQEGKP